MHPVPEDRLRVLSGGETIGPWRVEYTPGHAWHHVAYLHEPTGTAMVGDVAGCRIADGPILPPTPPPDVDLEAWHASLRVVAAWEPERIAITHFGTWEDVGAHLDAMHEGLDRWGEVSRRLDDAGYAAAIEEEMRTKTSDPATPRRSPARCRRRCCGPGGRGTGPSGRRRRRATDRPPWRRQARRRYARGRVTLRWSPITTTSSAGASSATSGAPRSSSVRTPTPLLAGERRRRPSASSARRSTPGSARR